MTTKPDSQGHNLAAVACLNDPFPNPCAEPPPGGSTEGVTSDSKQQLSPDEEDAPTLSDLITPLPGTLRQVTPLEGLEKNEENLEDPLGLDDAVTRVTSIGAELAKAVESLEHQDARVRPSESKLRTPPPPKPERRSVNPGSRRITPRIDLNELKAEVKDELRSEPKSSRFKTPPPPKPLRALENRNHSSWEARPSRPPSNTNSGAFRLESGRIVEADSTPPPPTVQPELHAPLRPSSSSRLAVVTSSDRPSSRERVSTAPLKPGMERKTPDKPFDPYRLSTFVLPEALRGQLNALEPPSLTDADFSDRDTTPPPAPREPSEVTQVAAWSDTQSAPRASRPSPPALPVASPQSSPPNSLLGSPSVQPLTFPSVPVAPTVPPTAPHRARSVPKVNVAHREARARRFVGLAAAAFGLSLLGFGAVTYLQSTDLLSGAHSGDSVDGMALDQISDPELTSDPEVRVLAASPQAGNIHAGTPSKAQHTPAAANPVAAHGAAPQVAPVVKPVTPEGRAAQPASTSIQTAQGAPAVAAVQPKSAQLAAAGALQVQAARPQENKLRADGNGPIVAAPSQAAPRTAPAATQASVAKPTSPAKADAPTVAAKPPAAREKTAAAPGSGKGRSKNSVFDTMMAPPEE